MSKISNQDPQTLLHKSVSIIDNLDGEICDNRETHIFKWLMGKQ